MKVTMQELSEEIIKPSSPTPHHLRKLKLSYIDQLHRSHYVPLIFFYAANESTGLTTSNHSQISHRLKQSLSNTLTAFYPLAGTVNEDGSLADCNDTGAAFIEARVEAHLDIVSLKGKNTEELETYLPFHPKVNEVSEITILTGVKLTFFKCGGISVGISMSHRIADGGSLFNFMNAWAATCRGQPDFFKMSFNIADYFPARTNLPSQNAYFMPLSDENCSAKRFIFDEETLRVLKQKAASAAVTNPSRVEAVSAFIWMHLIAAITKSTTTGTGTFPVMLAVSLRGRTKPSLSLENVFGNCYVLSMGLYHADNRAVFNRYHDLVSVLRGSVKKIDHDYITKAQRGDNYLDDYPLISSSYQTKGALMEVCVFSSWCRFPSYEVDYGWGSPAWVCTTASPVKNTVILMSTKCGKGIEALINTEKDKLEMLDAQIKLISQKVETDGQV